MGETKARGWICRKCGERHGRRIPVAATLHYGRCDWCGKDKVVTEPRDYGIVPPSEFYNEFLRKERDEE